MRPTARGLIAGGIAGAMVVALMLRGVFTAGLPAVALALWERATRLIPLEVIGFFIVRFKFAAKPLGFWGMLASLVAGWAVLGAVLRVRPLRSRGLTALLAFALVFVPVAGLTLPLATGYLGARLEAESAIVLPSRLTARVLLELAWYAGVFAAIYALLIGRPRAAARPEAAGAAAVRDAPPGAKTPQAATPEEGHRMSRRRLLRRGAMIGGLLAGSTAAHWLADSGGRPAAYAQSLFQRVRGLRPEVTPTDQFYVVSKNPPGFDPLLRADRWRLEVAAAAGQSVVLTLDDIKAMPATQRAHTLECISNEVGGDLISTAVWRGVRLRDVLARAGGVSSRATKVVFRCADGYSESLPVADALHRDTLLVYLMNGEPLPSKHGFPVRLLVPGRFGMKNPKWITKIEAVDYDFQGYWERSGWSDLAIVKTMSKFDAPGGRHLMPQQREEVGLGGVAYAGDRGIKAVEVSTDDGRTWQPAEIRPPLGRYTWILWAALWKPTAPGEYTLKVRARDGMGVLQTATEVGTLPDGASGYHRIRVHVRK